MKLLFNNQNLIENSNEGAILQSLASAGNNVSVSMDDNSSFAINDFAVVGSFLSPKTEIAKINSAVTLGTSVQLDSLTFPHPAGSPIIKIMYDKVRMYSALTINGTKTLVDTKDIDVDQENTEFELSDSSTGYRFFVLFNSSTSTEGKYSPGIDVGGTVSTKSYSSIYNFVKLQYPDDLSQDMFEMFLQTAIDEIFGMRNWSFREGKSTFTPTEGVYEYSIAEDVGITDFGTLVSARTDNRILSIISGSSDDALSLNQNVVAPFTVFEWAGKFHIRMATTETITFRYLKSTESLLTSQSETRIKLFSAVGFRILSLLYITKDQKLSEKFGLEYQRTIKILKKTDRKNIEIPSLPETRKDKTKFRTPAIT